MSVAPAARAHVLVILLAALAVGLLPAQDAFARDARPAPVGSDRFATGQLYRGDFPDPSVLRFGNVYYAYSTTISGLNLPVMTSRDLVHWRARGEGLMKVAAWARSRHVGSRTHATTWAPTVARFRKTFVHAYATPTRTRPRKMCISTSRSSSALGGFVDRRRSPLICPRLVVPSTPPSSPASTEAAICCGSASRSPARRATCSSAASPVTGSGSSGIPRTC